MSETAVYAAGGVVWRVVEDVLYVLLIHRTKYRDVTLPKGKVDPGETLAETAVREIFEETGIKTALGVPVGLSRYRLPSKRQKIVHYWSAEATDAAVRASAFVPNKEIAAIEWVTAKKARKRLSYPVDLEILDNFLTLVEEGVLHTFPLIVLRHAKAVSRSDWDGSDEDRPLTDLGRQQARAVAGPLRAFGVEELHTSPAKRCAKTLAPLARVTGIEPRKTSHLSQDAWDKGKADVRKIIGQRVRARTPAVLSSHRPVLPEILSEVALATGTLPGSYLASAATLEPAAFSVIHLSRTNPGSGIIAIETHVPKD
ncbi:NUDIX domain-containing protein [Microbacterium sp. C7(2022)]|uniref:NUDIX hydrolase n=1 Tax=Microbacterium sp. C7(2022) TaxID=2992759 RepID=UPI00237BB111|nr:NUDIX domain-containing protein [Microbacterium sp. C7(2022)]MDE0547145.1 NUDIX hydrolase [Microbacterium sp. C7(2022)]